jgi:hypothetical protein
MKHPIAVCGHIYWVGVNDYLGKNAELVPGRHYLIYISLRMF